ncbi:hypothetical protein FisN_26Lh062 [Fistulifera solaris]|uniref:Uncharacterized protein n=1 Tax=Fistulifera solaris TaxID=1519565 RepID=A0A1Z5KCK4_FISSO|nr:hypothetical protein FisN_26Lh062 [Fistulifera solaris]|eukprot:GAX23999.1 hypothetical protein FisN_26Lh062 [Fistulifera solaris]
MKFIHALLLIANLSLSTATPWISSHTLTTMKIRGGSSSSSDYRQQLQAIQSQILQSSSTKQQELRQQIVEEGKIVPDLGMRADAICLQALQDFAAQAPEAVSPSDAAAYDEILQNLEQSLDGSLQNLYWKQLSSLRAQALEQYQSNADKAEALFQADAFFVQAAEASSRAGWEYATERAFLQRILQLTAVQQQQAQDVKLQAAQQQQTAMTFLQSQQQMIQQLQMQLYGQSSPWNVGMAYRIPDTNFNLQGTYQQGRANVQLSCVPDEYAPFLGPNGFTNGVGPGNLGLSLNLSF